MKKDIKIQFTLEQWISQYATKCMNALLKDVDPSTLRTDTFKVKAEEENEDREIVREFLEGLRKKKSDNRELINSTGFNNHPFPELIELPQTKHFHKRFMNEMEELAHETLYCQLLLNNKIPCYYKLFWSLTDDHRRRNSVCMSLNVHKNEELYLSIFQHALKLCPPSQVQTTYEYLFEQYEALEKIDSKEEAKTKEQEIRFDFHKSLRQADMLGNGHVDSIIHNLLNLSDVPHRAAKAVFQHIKEGI
jgi:hypothetical protein